MGENIRQTELLHCIYLAGVGGVGDQQWSYGKGRVEIGGPKMCFKSDGSSCHGDSGGGMFLKTDKQRSLIGVCSYGLADCKNWAPEVYTKVRRDINVIF